jgi:transcriptional repressor NrdR
MRCPVCNSTSNTVVDSRLNKEGNSTRRRRNCDDCQHRFTTYERVEDTPIMVVKKDSRREPFDRKKLLNGLLRACEKCAISMDQIETLTNEIELSLQEKNEKEVSSTLIGKEVMKRLRELDDIAYVRFASVYRQFKDINEFMTEVRDIIKDPKGENNLLS